jgi:hypothetical protein
MHMCKGIQGDGGFRKQMTGPAPFTTLHYR